MSYIAPNTEVKLLENVLIDNTYKHTLYFPSASAQLNWFNTKVQHTYSSLSFQRHDGINNTIKLGVKSELIMKCNYLMFKNSSYGNKWFYCFITNIEYINNETTYVSFEIDVMQTWFFDFSLSSSFVEREHPLHDVAGDNLIPEKLELGDYICNSFDGTGKFRNYQIIVASTTDETGANAVGDKYGGIYSGLHYNVFSSVSAVNSYIELLNDNQKADGIVSIFMFPADLIPTPINGSVSSHEIDLVKQQTTVNHFTPKNKKLLTYPYNFLYVTNLQGNSATYNYEYFRTPSCKFTLANDISCNPNVILFPMDYKGLAANFNEKIGIEGFPQCAYTTDSFKAWLAQNASSLGVKALSTAMGFASSNPVGVMYGVTTVANTLAQVYNSYMMPPQAHGSTGSSANVAFGIQDFCFSNMSIREEYARIIDEYFSMYGYATNRVKIPLRNSRPYWNYVKTIGCNLVGSIPQDAMTKIKAIHDNGVTYWTNGNNIGSYTLDNAPT